MNVLHITAHLGGGVGRVLSRVSAARKEKDSDITDSFICLEPPEKLETVAYMREAGIKVYICPESSETDHLIDHADIVQLEWWHHPLLTGFMCKNTITARLVIWSHTSGLSYPEIPLEFIYSPHVFLFTTPVVRTTIERTESIATVHSSGGFDDIPFINRPVKKGSISYAYLGTPNFSKLHPRIADFLAAVKIPEFKVAFFGDAEANPELRSIDKIDLRGFTSEPQRVLSASDILIYLLNPDHYGTTENALLEAMAAGVVPVVLNNPVETYIVRHKVTGMVVDTPEAFANALDYMNDNRKILQEMSVKADKDIRERFSLGKTVQGLEAHYRKLMLKEKRPFNFSSVFGNTPHEWFMSCTGKYARFFASAPDRDLRYSRLLHPVLYEQSKSSAFQFSKYFPQDEILKQWAIMLEKDLRDE